MVDYRRIRTGPRSRDRIEPGEVLAMHRATRAFIKDELARPYDGPTVVVTHHAPHPASLQDPHADLAWSYASDLTDMIMDRGPDIWIHGHVHHAADYRIGRTRVVCNPRGTMTNSRALCLPSLSPCSCIARRCVWTRDRHDRKLGRRIPGQFRCPVPTSALASSSWSASSRQPRATRRSSRPFLPNSVSARRREPGASRPR